MKIISRILSLAIITSALVFFASCGGDDPPPPAQKVQLDKLSKTWSLVSASLTGVTGTPPQIKSNFQLTISGTFNSANPDGPYNYSVTGTDAPSPWPPSGNWEFASVGSGNSGTIIRQPDSMPITYSIGSDNRLTMTFTCPIGGCNFAGSRVSQVVGTWTFVLQ